MARYVTSCTAEQKEDTDKEVMEKSKDSQNVVSNFNIFVLVFPFRFFCIATTKLSSSLVCVNSFILNKISSLMDFPYCFAFFVNFLWLFLSSS